MNTSANQIVSKESLLRRVFSDHKHYPYGFSRSGDFSIAESKALSAYGCYYAALADGLLPATEKNEIAFIDALNGKLEAQDTAQRAWIKYQKRINRPKTASIHGSSHQTKDKSSANDSDEELIDIVLDDDIIMDIDD